MKKELAAAISVAAAALGTSVVLCPSAVADTACPYDMSTAAGQQALTDATVAASNQVRSDEASYGPAGNQALADKDLQIQADNSRVILACSGKSSPASSQALANADQMVANDQAVAKQQADEQAAMNAPPPPAFDFGDPHQANNNGACRNLNNMYTTGIGGVLTAGGDLVGAVTDKPGPSTPEGMTLLGCGASDLINDAVNPTPDNMGDTGFAACQAAVDFAPPAVGALASLPGVHPCGN